MTESELFRQIKSLQTEQRNPASESIDIASTEEILRIINNEDKKVATAVEKEIQNIAAAVDIITNSLSSGGRLLYVGAGTSGRLGILDASECPPTFGTDPGLVQGIIAGGKDAVFRSQEGAEDVPENGASALRAINLSDKDVVCGIAASGRTPYVSGALKYARELGCRTIIISTVPLEKILEIGIEADVYINPVVGPEVVTGSTRMKSGTAQKFVLNMLTTATMVKMGKTYGNVMIDLQQTNKKLVERSRGIIMEICGVDYDTAANALNEANGHVKSALVMLLCDVDYKKAQSFLDSADGKVKIVIKNYSETDA